MLVTTAVRPFVVLGGSNPILLNDMQRISRKTSNVIQLLVGVRRS